MPGAHTHIYNTSHLNLIIYINHGPGSMDSAGKRVKSTMNRRTGRHCRPVLQLPTGQFLQLANMLYNSRRSWRTWNEQGAKQH